jgi:hypothetical protein
MIEILGAELDKVFEELNINAKKTYEIKNKPWDYCETYQVWELSEEDFEKISEIEDNDWKEEWGWWRFAKGSNAGSVGYRYNINNHYINVWDGVDRESTKDWCCDRKYSSLLKYFCNEMGASAERNVCALAVDLAMQNGMTMGELFNKYQG